MRCRVGQEELNHQAIGDRFSAEFRRVEVGVLGNLLVLTSAPYFREVGNDQDFRQTLSAVDINTYTPTGSMQQLGT